MKKRICITGGAGFIGSHFAKLAHQKLDVEQIVIYDKLTYAADLNRLNGIEYTLVEGDVCNANHLAMTLKKYDITHVVHFAAESHVDRSISDDMPFIQTNIMGTAAVLDALEMTWGQDVSNKMFVHISTDEVYGTVLETEQAADENTVLKPGNPYSATKAAADQLVLSRIYTNTLPAIIVRSSNNFGKHQHAEKLIPKVISNLIDGKPIPLYGDGKQKRCWISAKTYAEILCQMIDNNVPHGIYNVRGKETYDNFTLVSKIRSLYTQLSGNSHAETAPIIFVPDRKAHDLYYHIDDKKIQTYISVSYERMENFLYDEIKERLRNL